ncbi:helix-turn-helix domain-containing protein [Seohaeicola saemankumensis]|uniref:winged helix-turn-helix transcriptional regulator n=1 Tax=Seohaeicola saemankumensis TaxID=481181 RepID=UPI0035D0A7BD
MRWDDLKDENCSFARALSVVGDRWTLMILRDCFLKVRRFEDFQSRLGMGRGILADRLKKLTDEFILTKIAYQQNPTRYEYRLTERGLDLFPVIISLVHWGDVHKIDKKGKPVQHVHLGCGQTFEPIMCCSECGEPVDSRSVKVIPGPGGLNPVHLPLDRQPNATVIKRSSNG